MTAYFETSMDQVTPNGVVLERHGIKRVQITYPSKEIEQIIIKAFPHRLSSDLDNANSELLAINNRLRDTLPFLQSQSYEAYRIQEFEKKEEDKRRHFRYMSSTRTLEEMTQVKEVECSEHALAVQQVMFPEWDLYRYVDLRGNLCRHIILAQQSKNVEYMMVIDPTFRLSTLGYNKKKFVVSKTVFDEKFVREPIKKE
jgi:hypothetical protein